jgi:hypothetical protein
MQKQELIGLMAASIYAGLLAASDGATVSNRAWAVRNAKLIWKEVRATETEEGNDRG